MSCLKCGAWRLKAVMLLCCIDWLRTWCYMITGLQLLKVSSTKWAVIPCIHQAADNGNIHWCADETWRQTRGLRANKRGRHVWFVDVTKSWTSGFVLKWKLAVNSTLLSSFQWQERTAAVRISSRDGQCVSPSITGDNLLSTLELAAVTGVKAQQILSLAVYSRSGLLYVTGFGTKSHTGLTINTDKQ